MNIASGSASQFNITYNCDEAGSSAWGKIGLRMTAFEIISNKTTTYDFTYIKICSMKMVHPFDISYVIVMVICFLFVLFFTNEDVQVDFVNRETRFSPLHTVLFFGAGVAFLVVVTLLREFMIGFMLLSFIICSGSAAFLFFQWVVLQVMGASIRQRRIGRYINLSDLYAWSFSLVTVGGWLAFRDWISGNLIALSLLFVILRMVQIKKFTMLLFLTIFFFLFDLIWFIFTPKTAQYTMATFSNNISFPLKISLPKIMPSVVSQCAAMGIGDVVLPGMCYKLMKVFEREHGLRSSLSHSTLIGYFFGLSCCVFSMVFWNSIKPVNLFVIPFILLGILGAAAGSGNIVALAKFTQGQPGQQQQMFAPQEDFDEAERNIQNNANENENLLD